MPTGKQSIKHSWHLFCSFLLFLLPDRDYWYSCTVRSLYGRGSDAVQSGFPEGDDGEGGRYFISLLFTSVLCLHRMRTEIGLINSPELWMVCLLLVTVAVVGKLGGCAIAARLVGESWKDSLTIGTLMNTRGLMELVALNIGYEMGVLPPSIFVILVIMALVTTFMTTPLLHLVEHIFVTSGRKIIFEAQIDILFRGVRNPGVCCCPFMICYLESN